MATLEYDYDAGGASCQELAASSGSSDLARRSDVSGDTMLG